MTIIAKSSITFLWKVYRIFSWCFIDMPIYMVKNSKHGFYNPTQEFRILLNIDKHIEYEKN